MYYNNANAVYFDGLQLYKEEFGQSYQYDSKGNVISTIDLNKQSSNFEYNSNNDLIKEIDPKGNNFTYTYDSKRNIKTAKSAENVVYSFTHDSYGNPLTRGNIESYNYNKTNGNLDSIVDTSGKTTSYSYTNNNEIKYASKVVDGNKITNGYTYNNDKLDTITHNGFSYKFGYDPLGNDKAISVGSKISYTYNKNGNIETITENSKTTKYYYNELDELKKEEVRNSSGTLEKSIKYYYDAGGNILKKEEFTGSSTTPSKTINYKYGDSNWRDKLTEFNGKAITYDAIGNPLTYDGTTFSWEEGRQLAKLSKNGLNISYKYNSDGIRTEKTVNGVTTKYRIVDNKVKFESDGRDEMYYTYDSEDNLVSIEFNGVEYFYIRNAQGDIIGLIDAYGNRVVSYTYDTWGKLISISGSLKDTVGVKNPYRYRGYRYDTETGLYYLQSRYYNPEWGRFINADGIVGETGELLSHNMFVYCLNNPVNMEDSNGYFARIIGKVIVKGIKIVSKVLKPTKKVKKLTKAKKTLRVSKSVKYAVGAHKDIKGVKGYDSHHVGQKAVMRKLVKNYDEKTGPAIRVPGKGHTSKTRKGDRVSTRTKGITNARDLLARDIRELRRVYPDIPNSQLRELINMNKSMYPEMRK